VIVQEMTKEELLKLYPSAQRRADERMWLEDSEADRRFIERLLERSRTYQAPAIVDGAPVFSECANKALGGMAI
jgi:hypothetical protein